MLSARVYYCTSVLICLLFFLAVSNLSQPGTFAGNDAIVAFARSQQVKVVIHQLNTPLWEVGTYGDSQTGTTAAAAVVANSRLRHLIVTRRCHAADQRRGEAAVQRATHCLPVRRSLRQCEEDRWQLGESRSASYRGTLTLKETQMDYFGSNSHSFISNKALSLLSMSAFSVFFFCVPSLFLEFAELTRTAARVWGRSEGAKEKLLSIRVRGRQCHPELRQESRNPGLVRISTRLSSSVSMTPNIAQNLRTTIKTGSKNGETNIIISDIWI